MLITAGGRIKCRRCTAKSSRTTEQCKRPASKLSKTSKCSRHGGLSTGPKTKEGKDRIRSAHLKHGRETLEAKAKRSAKSAMFFYLRDLGEHLKMFEPKKNRGKKPSAYVRQDLISRLNILEIILRIENLKKS